ncbi:MAG: histidine kinase [Anaerolineaceae bacterium]|nr:histidine kinase [Anaerolineaceae bacterium]
MQAPFFKSLRGKTTLAYTFVTALGLSLIIMFLMVIGLVFYRSSQLNGNEYFSDALIITNSKASQYLHSKNDNPASLQSWLENYVANGHASLEPVNAFDAGAAIIQPDADALIIDAQYKILAAFCPQKACAIGSTYKPDEKSYEDKSVKTAFLGMGEPIEHYYQRDMQGHYRIAIPIMAKDGTEIKAVVLLTLLPEQPRKIENLMPYTPLVVAVILLLMVLTIPFGALFGWMVSGGFSRRMKKLSQAADAWDAGNLDTFPMDKSNDEVGILTRKLRGMAERTQTALQSQQQLAAVEERNRLARELHDTVKQQNFATLMQIRAASKMIAKDPVQAGSYLAEAERLLKSSQEELGSLINELKPVQMNGIGLGTAIRQFCEDWSKQNRIPVEVEISNAFGVGLDREQSLYRIMQEAFSNIARHAHASQVKLKLTYEPTFVDMVIQDNGEGFTAEDEAIRGYGLNNMKQRAEELYGQILINSQPGQGTALRVVLPLPANRKA